jgi:hypothetical protein
MSGDGLTLRDNAHGGNDLLQNLSTAGARMFGDAETADGATVCGNDRLISGAGNDVMWGDAQYRAAGVTTGADRFVFLPGNGQDSINDFETGKDRIDLTAYATLGVHGLGDIVVSSLANGTLLSLPGGNTVTVMGSVPVGGDFLFA